MNYWPSIGGHRMSVALKHMSRERFKIDEKTGEKVRISDGLNARARHRLSFTRPSPYSEYGTRAKAQD